MTVIIFILVLVALIVVHEFGHFVTAKWFGMKVEEFGLGYPPRAVVFARRHGTEYTLNWLPFGGFVKIKGEDDTELAEHDSFSGKPHWQQALVLLAGIAMNLVFAWLLITITLAIGMPRGLTDAEIAQAPDAALAISAVLPGSPAERAGIMPGDILEKASTDKGIFTGADADAFTDFIAASAGKTITLELERNNAPFIATATPATHTVESAPERAALGVGVAAFGTLPVPFWEAPIDGATLTYGATVETAKGLANFFGGIATGSADLSQVSGPVGIAGAVGNATRTSAAALLTLTAVISINLALINVIPVPALDGGRLLFVIIEAIIRKPLPKAAANIANTIGFGLLILLMLVVTGHDVLKLFS